MSRIFCGDTLDRIGLTLAGEWPDCVDSVRCCERF